VEGGPFRARVAFDAVDDVCLLIACPDRPGIVAAVSSFLFERGANIVDSAQHSTDPEGGTFFMRMAFRLELGPGGRAGFEDAFAEIAERFTMEARFSYRNDLKRVAILVSRQDHCLLDLLWRWRRGELGGEVVHVVSNHPDLEPDARFFGLPFDHVPVEPGRKPAAEARLLQLLDGRVDLVVLARYMQILSGELLGRLAVPVINIHHSFLPAFIGPEPYRRAYERGVKIIGATAHYVTAELDAGPIIEQDVERVSHRHDLADLEQIGRDIERTVLSRAVAWHLDDRVLAHANRTVVF
jgi:formyltetrahydrofolate deformylase